MKKAGALYRRGTQTHINEADLMLNCSELHGIMKM